MSEHLFDVGGETRFLRTFKVLQEEIMMKIWGGHPLDGEVKASRSGSIYIEHLFGPLGMVRISDHPWQAPPHGLGRRPILDIYSGTKVVPAGMISAAEAVKILTAPEGYSCTIVRPDEIVSGLSFLVGVIAHLFGGESSEYKDAREVMRANRNSPTKAAIAAKHLAAKVLRRTKPRQEWPEWLATGQYYSSSSSFKELEELVALARRQSVRWFYLAKAAEGYTYAATSTAKAFYEEQAADLLRRALDLPERSGTYGRPNRPLTAEEQELLDITKSAIQR